MSDEKRQLICENLRALICVVWLGFLMAVGVVEEANAYTAGDFDGDGRTDIAVFRRSDGYWHILKSSGGGFSIKWGLSNDIITPGNYDDDDKTDIAVYRYSDPYAGFYDNYYYILQSSDNGFRAVKWGVNTGFEGDTPMFAADYDGDGKTDLAVFHITDLIGEASRFTILKSLTETKSVEYWGLNGVDKPVPADYDGDGKADLAVFRRAAPPNIAETNYWFILQSSNNTVRVERFGRRTDKFVQADYDGDGSADIAVWRPSDGVWYRINSKDNSYTAMQFGQTGDKPVPGDYDGDGETDLAVFRPSTGVWYLRRSTEGMAARQFGLSDDLPVQSAFVDFFNF